MDFSSSPATRTRMCLSTALLLAMLAAPGSLQAQASKRTKQSFLNFRPNSSDYQQALEPTVRELRALLQGEAGAPTPSNLLQTIAARRAALPRGYHDELYFFEGLVHEKAAALPAALAAYEKSIALDLNRPAALFRKALVLDALQRHEESIETLREFLWLSKANTHEAHYLIGKNLCAAERCPEGLAEVEKARELNPRFTAALQFLVEKRKESLAALKDPLKRAELEAQIAADLFALVRLDPNNRSAALQLARYSLVHADPLIHAEKLNEAELLAQRLVDESQYADTEAVRLLFDIHIRRGRSEQAAAVLEQGLKVNAQAAELLQAKRQLQIQRQVESSEAESS